MSESKAYPEYGCHVDLADGEEPDDCVLSYGAPDDCIFAGRRRVPHTCKYWKKREAAPTVTRAPDPEVVEVLGRLLDELDWVNEQLDLMPDDYAQAHTDASALLTKLRSAS